MCIIKYTAALLALIVAASCDAEYEPHVFSRAELERLLTGGGVKTWKRSAIIRDGVMATPDNCERFVTVGKTGGAAFYEFSGDRQNCTTPDPSLDLDSGAWQLQASSGFANAPDTLIFLDSQQVKSLKILKEITSLFLEWETTVPDTVIQNQDTTIVDIAVVEHFEVVSVD